jgi:hypothetical protein
LSRIYFHTRDGGDAEVLGAERAHMGCTVSDVALAFTPSFGDQIVRFLPSGHHLRAMDVNKPAWANMFRATMNHGEKKLLTYQGQPVASFDLLLNTALAIGNDPLCLFAKLHAQCEIHAWVEGQHRAWLADLIEQGRESGLYRDGAGWEAVVKLLRASDDAPVVTSYSVCESFPNAYVANWNPPTMEDGEPDHDAWYELPDQERWDLAIAGLRASRDVPPLSPERLRAMFGQRLTLIDIFSQSTADHPGPRPQEKP